MNYTIKVVLLMCCFCGVHMIMAGFARIYPDAVMGPIRTATSLIMIAIAWHNRPPPEGDS